MENRIEETFISGFCKAQNQTRTVLCETEQKADGTNEIISTDCAYGKCEHTKDCLLMKNILQG